MINRKAINRLERKIDTIHEPSDKRRQRITTMIEDKKNIYRSWARALNPETFSDKIFDAGWTDEKKSLIEHFVKMETDPLHGGTVLQRLKRIWAE